MDAGTIGRACLLLGAGRQTTSDAIDYAVGCSTIRKIGERVEKGEPLLKIHARDAASLQTALPLFEQAVAVA
jgi:thymidine phosphorylase